MGWHFLGTTRFWNERWRMASIGTDLYAGGIFTTAGNLGANNIAKYSCTLPTGINELSMNKQTQLNQNQPNPLIRPL